MIRNRTFMMGLGLGLLLGALLLQLMILGQGTGRPAGEVPSAASLTKEELEQQAETMDLKVVGKEDKLMTEEEWKQQMVEQSSVPKGDAAKAPKATDAGKQPDKPQQPAASKQPKSVTPGSGEASAAKQPQTPSVPAAKAVEVKIASGNNLEDVAGKLEKAGVIADADQFVQKGRSLKISTKIQTGQYTFSPGEEFSSIIAKITTKPSR
ncbi:endolytic transglycosylase MltG [Paenibacillus cellulositrophicus]|uniref:endolytic transglycosylase MltG n=1 Tax=Paenibacillus cellulositrophicus TaxID=562959 RepID=UPI0012671775|nr:endolytic transglycosylase MltG [Paenibacillus cellulositrophicus]